MSWECTAWKYLSTSSLEAGASAAVCANPFQPNVAHTIAASRKRFMITLDELHQRNPSFTRNLAVSGDFMCQRWHDWISANTCYPRRAWTGHFNLVRRPMEWPQSLPGARAILWVDMRRDEPTPFCLQLCSILAG